MELKKFKKQLKQIKKQKSKEWKLHKVRRLRDDAVHPISYKDIECAFVSAHLNVPPKSKILNVGSYNQYIIGLLSNYYVTTLDVRARPSFMDVEEIVTEDVKETTLPDASFDAIISLSSIEHFGLGRYGDNIDLKADEKAFKQFKRLLKPNGLLLFTTTIKRGKPEICFNAHKTYTKEIIDSFSAGFNKEVEMYINKVQLVFCQLEEITDKKQTWDIYCGCWRKV